HALVIGTGEPSETNAWYGGLLFDVTATGPLDIILSGDFDIDIDTTSSATYRLYTKSGTYVGSEETLSDWTLWGEQTVTGNGKNNWTPLSLGSTQQVTAGETMGIAIFAIGPNAFDADGAIGYRDGGDTFVGEGLTLSTGAARPFGNPSNPFTAAEPIPDAFYPDRTWSGQIYYEAVPEPATMLALGAGLALLARKRRK
ncbi:MAG: PEP-CTERM sorting domain-containing protein, partial [Fimbriimonadaceae bacterium]